MNQPYPEGPFFDLNDFVPSLRQEIEKHPFSADKLLLAALPITNPGEQGQVRQVTGNRHLLAITQGKEFWTWEVESLQSLFRGTKKPPVLGDYPEAYQKCFLLMDMHFLEVCDIFGDRRDAEMLEVFSALRRRPDGRSLGFVHDYMWQAAALVLGTFSLSQAEYEAIIARLERSCRTFEMGPGSQNYAMSLHMTLGQAGKKKD